MSELLIAPPMPKRPRPRPVSRWVVSYSPTTIAAFLAMFGLAFIVPLGSKGALLYLMAGMGLFLSQPGQALHALRREWILILIALWCLMSFAWSAYPALSMRYGIQLLLTVVITVTIAYRVSPMSFIRIIFVTSSLAGLASLLVGRARGDGGGYLGIYASKNALADASSLLILVSLAVLVDRRMGARWRLPALMMLPMGAMLLLMGKSSGALVSTLAVVLVYGAIVVLQRMTPSARLVTIALSVVFAAFVAVVLYAFRDQLAQSFLELTGKDVTLTGRTDLWAVALSQIAERPLLGTGFQAFWVQGQPLAEQLWAQFGISTRQGFHFHNTPLSNAVEIGLPMVALQVLVFVTAVWGCLAWSIRQPSAASIFFALVMTRLFLLMWIEVAFFIQFVMATVFVIMAICYVHQVGALVQRQGVRASVIRPQLPLSIG